MKKLKGILVLVLLMALLASPVAALASNVTQAKYYALIQVTNNGTAVTNEITTCNISTTNLINGGFLNSSANNCAIQSSAGADLPFMPGVTDDPWTWAIWVPAMGADSIKTDILYTANSTGGKIRYFPDTDGMTAVDDDADFELGDNFTVEQSGWVNTSMPVEGKANFLTFIEVDANNKLTVYADNATAVNADRDEDVYLYKDEGVDYFDALDIDFEIYVSSLSLDFAKGGIAFSDNVVGTMEDFDTNEISVYFYEDTPLVLTLSRGKDTAIDTYLADNNTSYYCTLYREAGNDSANCTIYSDTTRETLLDTLAVAGFGATKWRYIYGFINWNQAQVNRDFDGYVKDLIYPQRPALVEKAGAFKTYVSATGNITSEIFGGPSVSATGVASGEYPVKTDEQLVLGFDGNDLVDCGNNALLQFANPFTLMAWVKPDGVDEVGYLIARYDDVFAGGYYLSWSGTTDTLRLGAKGVASSVSDAVFVDDGVWVHAAATLDASNDAAFYRNTVAAGTDSTSAYAGNAIDTLLGNRVGGVGAGNFFAGDMCEVKIYNQALSPAEITECFNGVYDETGLVAYYPLSEGAGATAHDTSGNGLDGAITGGNWGASFLRLYVDDTLEDFDTGAAVPNTSANWTYYQNLDDYWDYTEITIDGTQVQYIDWEYDTIFYDSSGFNNDATPSFRGAPSDPDVTAEFISFLPVAEAQAPPYVLEEGVDFIESVPVIVSEWDVTPPAGTFPLAGVIVAVADATETPSQLPLVLIAGFTIIALSLAISSIMRKYGSGTIFVKILVICGVMGVFVAIENFGINFWMIFVFAIIGISLAMASRQVSWN